MSNELKVLMSDRYFKVSSGEIVLKPFKFKQFALVLAIVEQYLIIFTSFSTTNQMIEELLAKSEDQYAILTDTVKLLSLVSGADASYFEELQYDEVLGLLVEVIDMNLDFFSRIGKTLNPTTEEKENLKTGESKSAA